MSTQGIVSIMKDGQVVMKIVAGCDGQHAKTAADAVRKAWPAEAQQAKEIAHEEGFGCPSCLAVITDTSICTDSEDEPNELYRKTFKDPNFNPRWKYGTADYNEIIDIDEPARRPCP